MRNWQIVGVKFIDQNKLILKERCALLLMKKSFVFFIFENDFKD